MKQVELYAKVRYAVQIDGLSKRAAARRFGIDPRTVDKMVEFSVPPGYRRLKPPARPKLGPFIARYPSLQGLQVLRNCCFSNTSDPMHCPVVARGVASFTATWFPHSPLKRVLFPMRIEAGAVP